jgi:hypothetical protein
VTLQTVQIQELIRQIDETLRKSASRFPWLQSNEADQQRQVLQQTRSYLLLLQQQAREAKDRPLTGNAANEEMAGQSVETAQQVLQAVLQEMNYLRTNMLQPLRSDIDALQQRRSTLAQEVQQLEAQRQQSLPAANQQFVPEFVKSSMQQLQENLTGQVANMLASLSAQASADQPLLGGADALSPAQRLQHMQRLQVQSDQLMMRLDSAIHIIFESMHANINSYEDSLEQGLNRMHTLGQQGEAMFSALVNRLAEHLGRETSTYLQSSLQPDASGFLETSSPSAETEIDQLLGELNGLEPTTQEAPDLDQLELSLEPLDFSTDSASVSFDDDGEINLLQHDLDFADEDITQFQESSELLLPILTTPTSVETEDLSSAMELLNQLNGGGIVWIRGESSESTDVDDLEAADELYQSLFGRSLFGDGAETEVRDLEVQPPVAEFVVPIADAPTETPIAEASLETSTEAAEISDMFFSGMGDPADEPEIETMDSPEFSDTDLSQSVETFLLKIPDSEPTASSSRYPQEVAVDPEVPPIEAIASLSDLLSDSTPPPSFQTEDSFQEEQFEENTYEPARPEESLLLDSDRQPATLDLDVLPDDARQLLESDLSNLEFSDSASDLPQVSPIQPQEDRTMFDNPDAENSSNSLQVFSDIGSDPTVPSEPASGLDLNDFDFSDANSPISESGLSLENFIPSESPSESTPETSMPQEHSSTPSPNEAFSTGNTGDLNAFSFDGLDDELFEQSSIPSTDGRSIESEDVLKKKRSSANG